MLCPKKFIGQTFKVSSSIRNKAFFETHSADKWTFEDFLTWKDFSSLKKINARLAEYKDSLESLRKKQPMDASLKSYVQALMNKKYQNEDLGALVNRQKPTISISNSTIISSNICTGDISLNDKKGKRKAVHDADDLYNLDNEIQETYIVDDVDILNQWKNYKIDSFKHIHNDKIQFESDIQKILSQAHILLLKENQYSPDLVRFISKEALGRIQQELAQKINMSPGSLPIEVELEMRAVLKEASNKTISPRKAGYMIMSSCSDQMDTGVDDAICVFRNLIERLPHQKLSCVTKESQLSSTYSDAILRPFLDDPSNDALLIWSNNILQKGHSERPDFVRRNLINTVYKDLSCIGEVKGEDKMDDKFMAAIDLIRLAMMSKEAIDKYNNKGIMNVQIVGFQMTFYVTSLFKEGMYVMSEICSIRMPSSLKDMRSFIITVEDLVPMRSLLKECQKKEEEESVCRKKKEGLTYETLKHLIKRADKDRKRLCPYTFNK